MYVLTVFSSSFDINNVIRICYCQIYITRSLNKKTTFHIVYLTGLDKLVL